MAGLLVHPVKTQFERISAFLSGSHGLFLSKRGFCDLSWVDTGSKVKASIKLFNGTSF